METLLSLGLSNAVYAAALALVVAAVAWLFRHRPALVHGLWLLVLLRFVLPPLWSLPLPALTRDSAPEASASQLPGIDPAPPAVAAPSALDVGDVAPSTKLPDFEEAAGEPVVEGKPEWTEPGWLLAAAVWLAGSAGWWLLAGLRLARFHRQLRVAWPAPAEVQQQAQRLAARLGLRRCPRVWMVPAILSPLLVALGPRARLLLPVTLWQRLSAQQRDTILAHELAHLRRKDHWVRRLELLVLGLYWWHPVAWWAQRRLHEAEEECCDDWVLTVLPEAAGAYASTLVETLAYLSGRRAVVPVSASGLGQVDSLKRRLTMILGDDRPRSLPRWALAVLGAVLLMIPLLPGWAEPPRTPRSEGQGTADEEFLQPPSIHPGARSGSSSELPRRGRGTTASTDVQDLKDQVEILQAQLSHAQAVEKSKQAYLSYRQRQNERIQALAQRGSIEERIADEERDRKLAAENDLEAARAAVVELKIRLRIGQRRLAQQQGQEGQSLQEVREDLETAEAQVRVKEAELKAAEAAFASAKKSYERMTQLHQQAVVADHVVDEARSKMETRQGDIEVKKADLLAQTIRLKQARRRLEQASPKSPLPQLPARNSKPEGTSKPERNPPPRIDPQAERMQSLENKLNDIANELKELRRELDAQKKPASNTPPRTRGR